VLTFARQTLRVVRGRDEVSHLNGQTRYSVFLIRLQFHPCCSAQHFPILVYLISFLQVSYVVTRWGKTPVSYSGGHRFKLHPGVHLCRLMFFSFPRYRQEKSGAVSQIRPRLHYPTLLSIHYALSFCGIQSGPNVSCPVCKIYIKIRCKILSSLAVQ
jgi:hypothetical protein